MDLVVNSLCRRAKADLRTLGVELNEERRRAVYAQIRQSFLGPQGLTEIELAFSKQPMAGSRVLTTSLRYRIRRS